MSIGLWWVGDMVGLGGTDLVLLSPKCSPSPPQPRRGTGPRAESLLGAYGARCGVLGDTQHPFCQEGGWAFLGAVGGAVGQCQDLAIVVVRW